MPELHEKLVLLILRGVSLGLFVLGVWIVWSRMSRRWGWPRPAGGLLIAVAFLIGETAIRSVSLRAWLAILLLSGSELIFKHAKKRTIAMRAFFIVSGAAILSSWSIHPEAWWLRGFVVLATAYLAPATADLDERYASAGLVQLLLLLTLGGILTIVPDTEETGLLFGLMLAASLLVWPLRSASLSMAGGAPLIGLLTWAICVGGQGRPASVLASAGCLGLLVVEPMVHATTRARMTLLERLPPGTRVAGALLLHCLSIATAIVFARTTADLEQSAVAALAALGLPAMLLLTPVFLKGDPVK